MEEDKTPEDKCPTCGTYMSTFRYFVSIPGTGWFECPACGTIFAPESIRLERQKKREATIIAPPPGLKV